jgi:hypothetical protein
MTCPETARASDLVGLVGGIDVAAGDDGDPVQAAGDSVETIRPAISGRVVSARLAPEVEANLLSRAGVVLIQRRGDRTSLYHPDSDQLARLVLALDGTELEVVPQDLDAAFTAITSSRTP